MPPIGGGNLAKEGLICALAEGCFLRTQKPVTPDNNSRSLWSVVPRHTFERNEIYLKEKRRGRFVPFNSPMAEEAARENKDNESREQKLFGQPVLYGQVVQVRDVKANSYIAMRRPEAGDLSSPVYLSEGESAAYFKIVPGSKARKDGDPVHVQDSLLIINLDTQLNLFADVTEPLPFDTKGNYVVTGSRDKCFWIVNRFGKAGVTDALQVGDVFHIAHREHDGIMSLSMLPKVRMSLPFRLELVESSESEEKKKEIQRSLCSLDLENFFSSAVSAPFVRGLTSQDAARYAHNRVGEYWAVERVKENGLGGPVMYFEPLRFQHVVSGLYLAIHPDDRLLVRSKVEDEDIEMDGMLRFSKTFEDVGKLFGSSMKNFGKFLGEDLIKGGIEKTVGQQVAKKGVLRLFGRSKPKEEETEEGEEKEEEKEKSKIPAVVPTETKPKKEGSAEQDDTEDSDAPPTIRLYLTADPNDPMSHWTCVPSDRTLTRNHHVRLSHIVYLQHRLSGYYIELGQLFSLDQMVPKPKTEVKVQSSEAVEDSGAGLKGLFGGGLFVKSDRAQIPIENVEAPVKPPILPLKRRPEENESTKQILLHHFPAVDDIWWFRKIDSRFLSLLYTMSFFTKEVRNETFVQGRVGAPAEEDPLDFDALEYFLNGILETCFPWADRRPLYSDLDTILDEKKAAKLKGARIINKTHNWTQMTAASLGIVDVLIDLLYRIRPQKLRRRRKVTTLIFVLLNALSRQNDHIALMLFPHSSIIMHYCEDMPSTGAVQLLNSMYNASRSICVAVSPNDIPALLSICIKPGAAPVVPQVFEVLATLCTWEGTALVRNQTIIGNALFGKYERLVHYYEPGEKSTVMLVSMGINSNIATVMEGNTVEDRLIMQSHLKMLELMIALCEGQHMSHQARIQDMFPLYLLSYLLRQPKVPAQLKKSLIEVIRAVHIETVERPSFKIRELRFYPHVNLREKSSRVAQGDEDVPEGFDSPDLFHLFELLTLFIENFCTKAEEDIHDIRDQDFSVFLSVLRGLYVLSNAGQVHQLTSDDIGYLLDSIRRLLMLRPPTGSRHADHIGRQLSASQIEACRLLSHFQERAMDARLTMLWQLFCNFVDTGKVQETDVYDCVIDPFLNRIMTGGEGSTSVMSDIFISLLQSSSNFTLNYHALKFILAKHRVWQQSFHQFEKLDFMVGAEAVEHYKTMEGHIDHLKILLAQGVDEESLDDFTGCLSDCLKLLLDGCTIPASEGRTPTIFELEPRPGSILQQHQAITAQLDIHIFLLRVLDSHFQVAYLDLFKYCYRILYVLVLKNRKNAALLVRYLPVIVSHLPLDVLAQQLLEELLDSGPFVRQLDESDIDLLFDLLRKHGLKAKFLKLLRSACASSRFHAVYRKHQVRVQEKLRETREKFFPVMIHTLNPDDRLAYYTASKTDPMKEKLDYYEAFLRLLAGVSAQRNVDAQWFSRNYISAADALTIISDTDAPLSLKDACLQYLHNAYVDSDFQALKILDMENLLKVITFINDVFVVKLLDSFRHYEAEAADGVSEPGEVRVKDDEHKFYTISEFSKYLNFLLVSFIPLVRSLVSHPFFSKYHKSVRGQLSELSKAIEKVDGGGEKKKTRRRSRTSSVGSELGTGLLASSVGALTRGLGADVTRHVKHSARRARRLSTASMASNVTFATDDQEEEKGFESMTVDVAEIGAALTAEMPMIFSLCQRLIDLMLRGGSKARMSAASGPAWTRLIERRAVDAVVDLIDEVQDNTWVEMPGAHVSRINVFFTWYDDFETEVQEGGRVSPDDVAIGIAENDDNDDKPLLQDTGKASVGPSGEVIELKTLAKTGAGTESDAVKQKFAVFRTALVKFFKPYIKEENRLLDSTLSRLSSSNMQKLIEQATLSPPWPIKPLNDDTFVLFVLKSLQHIISSASVRESETVTQTQVSEEIKMAKCIVPKKSLVGAVTRGKINELGGTVRVLRLVASKNAYIRIAAMKTLVMLLEGGHPEVQSTILKEISQGSMQQGEWSFLAEIDGPLKAAVAELSQSERIVTALGGHGKEQRSASVFARSTEPAKEKDTKKTKSDTMVTLCLNFISLLCSGGNSSAQNMLREGDGRNIVGRLISLADSLAPSVRAGLELDSHLNEGIVVKFCDVLSTMVSVVSGPCAENQNLIINSSVLETFSELLSPAPRWSRASDSSEMETIVSGEAATSERKIVRIVVELLLSLLEGQSRLANVGIMNRRPFRENLRNKIDAYYAVLESMKNSLLQEEVLSEAMLIWILYNHLSSDPSLNRITREILDIPELPRKFFNSNLGRVEILRGDHLEVVLFQKALLSKTYLLPSDKSKFLWTANRTTATDKVDCLHSYTEDMYSSLVHRRSIQTSPWKKFVTSTRLTRGLDYAADIFAIIINILLVVSSTLPSDSQHRTNIWISVIILGIGQLASIFMVILSGFIMQYYLEMKTKYRHYLGEKVLSDPFYAGQKVLPRLFRHMIYFFSWEVFFKITLVVFSLLGIFQDVHFFAYHLLNVLYKSPLLLNVVRSVTQNGRSIVLTALLGIVVVYWYSIFAFNFFPNAIVKDYEARNDGTPKLCTNIFTCWVAILGQFPSGGDFLRERLMFNSISTESMYTDEAGAFVLQLSFFFIVIVIILSVLFGIIVDTFAELRNKRQSVKQDMISKCYVCDLEASLFDREVEGFERHIDSDHPIFGYVHYFVYIMKKLEKNEDIIGVDSWILDRYRSRDTSFYPMNRSAKLEYYQTLRQVKPKKTDFSAELLLFSSELAKVYEWMSSVEKDQKAVDSLLQAIVLQTQPVEEEVEDLQPGTPKTPGQGESSRATETLSFAEQQRRRRQAERAKKAAESTPKGRRK